MAGDRREIDLQGARAQTLLWEESLERGKMEISLNESSRKRPNDNNRRQSLETDDKGMELKGRGMEMRRAGKGRGDGT